MEDSTSDRSASGSPVSPLQRQSPSLEGAAAPRCEQNDEIIGKEIEEQMTDKSAPNQDSRETFMERLLEKQRNEIMFELRRLQLGDRPVTGQNNKTAVETFFQRALGESSTPAPDENRPENVVVEVNALVERRPVSSVLQSSQFRRTLENALRSAIGTSASTSNIARTRSTVPRSSVPTVSANQNSSSIPAPPPIPSGSLLLSDEPSPNLDSERPTSASRLYNGNGNQDQNRTSPVAVPTPPQQATGTGRAASWVNQVQEQVGLNLRSGGVDLNQWDHMQHSNRERMIEDISELVQRQLVTQTLESNFRHSLERRMQDRLLSSGISGNVAQQAINSLPRGTHQRNDFSDLGIGIPQALSDNLDEVSVISATAAVAVPYAQTNAAMSREMISLKAQLNELKNMMKLSFDLQMDIQRSIRQEVASALNNALAEATPPSRPVNDSNCTICLEKAADTVMYQCGHLCSCYTCALELRQRAANCPVCRAPIKDIIRTYRSS